ncbi:MAG: metallophosphoesterase [Candidatus Eisenbacteria bacterium]
MKVDSTELKREYQRERERVREGSTSEAFGPMFGDTLIGLLPGTADSSRRYLGRLRDGYTADTLNIFLLGDNRPGNRSTRLAPQYYAAKGMFSRNPIKIVKGLVAIPLGLLNGLFPDLALVRDIPGRMRHMPTWGPEGKVVAAMVTKLDSLRARGQMVAAVINTGDLVEDGRYPKQWERFLKIHKPITSRVPYFPVAGNHERTDAVEGVANWRTATGLPVGGDRLYYCFDSADGWVRFIALDSNPMADPAHLWTRETQIKYSEEEITWMVARLKEHNGPAFVFMHHPPFSVAFHRVEWQADSVLRDRRERMVKALHEAGIGVLATGHEHAYERALFTWPDAVLINIVTGGGGAPLHALPSPAQSARLFSQYKVAGAEVDPDNVVTGAFNHFVHVRLWFGGGSLHTYAVDKLSKTTLADMVTIDLKRYGVPEIDEHKVPRPPKAPASTGPHEEVGKKPNAAKADTIANSKRILTTPSPREASKRQVKRKVPVRDSVATARRDSVAAVRRDSLAARRKAVAPLTPIRPPRR